jgi:uncharacterized protein (TIRG00374 family)
MKFLKIFIILALIVLLFAFFFKDINLSILLNTIAGIHPIYPLLFFFGCLGQFFIRGYRWGIILKPHKKKIPLATLYNYTVIGFLLNIFPGGRIGEPARGILLARNENFKQSYGLASVVLERFIDILVMILILLASLYFLEDNSAPFLLQLRRISIYVFFIVLFIFSCFYLLNFKKIASAIEKAILFLTRIVPVKFRERTAHFLSHFIKGLRLNLSLLDFFKLFMASLLVWGFIIPFYWILMKGFDMPIDLFQVVPFFSIIIVIASIPMPGMAGTLDAGSKEALTRLYGVAEETASAYTLTFHFIILFCTLLAGLIAFKHYGLNFKSIKNIRKKNEMS